MTLAEKKFNEFKNLPENTGTIIKMEDGREVEFLSHFNEKTFSGKYDDSRYDHHEYHFEYVNIDSVIVYG